MAPFAYLSHDTASHTAWAGLGPPPGWAWLFSRLNSSVWLPQRSTEPSEGPQESPSFFVTLNPPHQTPLQFRPVNLAPQAEWQRRGVHTPRWRAARQKQKTEKKRRKEEKKIALLGWPNASLLVWQHNLWQSLRYCWSQANGLHTQNGSHGQGGRESVGREDEKDSEGGGKMVDMETENKKEKEGQLSNCCLFSPKCLTQVSK